MKEQKPTQGSEHSLTTCFAEGVVSDGVHNHVLCR